MTRADDLSLHGDTIEFSGRVVAILVPELPFWLRAELEKRLSDRGYQRGFGDGLSEGEACAFEGDENE